MGLSAVIDSHASFDSDHKSPLLPRLLNLSKDATVDKLRPGCESLMLAS